MAKLKAEFDAKFSGGSIREYAENTIRFEYDVYERRKGYYDDYDHWVPDEYRVIVGPFNEVEEARREMDKYEPDEGAELFIMQYKIIKSERRIASGRVP